MVEIDIPRSLFEEQGRQFYGANLLEMQVLIQVATFLGQSGNFDSSNIAIFTSAYDLK